ncbi:MAG TPA: hypothetical protein HA349_11595 [Methanotrichaceae archaeon]|nr:hypothetical protein [Methanotrichaceae archaeon]
MQGDTGENEITSTNEIGSQRAGRDIIQGRDINNAGRDISFYYELVEETEFFEPNLEPFGRKFISPNVIPQLIETARRNRLLMLGGSAGIDKSALARNLAWHLSKIQHIVPEIDKIPILEWNHSSSDQPSIEVKLQETTEATIFILPKVSPQDVRYDLSSIKMAADKNHHFVLISTDVPYPSWKLPKDDQHFWQDIPDNLYSVKDLAIFLEQRLTDIKDSLPNGVLGDIPIPEIAENLKTPDNISRFVTLLCAEKKPLQPQVIEDIIKDANDERRTIERWYPTLSSREQLLALGLSFFDDLFDDQFFAAMDRVVESVWQRRDSSLCALDYCDLDKLRNFYDFVETEGRGTKIESRFTEQRRMIFEVAWNSHRRQILTALPVIAQLASDSVAGRSHDPELYGTPARRNQLRRVIGEALSDIALISDSAVKRTLLQLASDENLGVQAVAARAMARWRQYGQDAMLFKTLFEWCEGSRGRDYILATVSLAVSYAARYDSPNQLNYKLCDLLKRIAIDQSPMVRDRFCNHTLKNIIPRHIKQLRDNEILEYMIQYIDLIPEIAKNLSLSYRYNNKDVNETLEIWYNKCVALRSSHENPVEITSREKLLAAVVLTYGQIEYEDVDAAEKAFDRLQNILTTNNHPFVHKMAVIAISHQASNNFEKIEPLLQNLLINVPENDSDEIIQILRDIYLEQRRKLERDDDYYIEVDGTRYSIWIDSERPQTAVEIAMDRWIKSPNNPAAQQIAVRALTKFYYALDQKEEQLILKIREQQKYLNESQTITKSQYELPITSNPVQRIRESKFWDKNTIRLATIRENNYNNIIQGILPEVLAQNESNQQAMAFILRKWHQSRDNEIRTIAMLQDRSIWFIERNILKIGAISCGILALLFIWNTSYSVLIIILLCALVLAWLKTHPSSAKKLNGINSQINQIALRFWDIFHK